MSSRTEKRTPAGGAPPPVAACSPWPARGSGQPRNHATHFGSVREDQPHVLWHGVRTDRCFHQGQRTSQSSRTSTARSKGSTNINCKFVSAVSSDQTKFKTPALGSDQRPTKECMKKRTPKAWSSPCTS